MRRLKPMLLIVGVLMALSVLLLGLLVVVASIVLEPFDDDGPQQARFDTVAEWSGADAFAERFELAVPPSARDIHTLQGGFQDPFYQVRYTIDADDLPLVTSSVGCNGLRPRSVSEAPIVIEEVDWWVPVDVESYGECDGGLDPPGRQQSVFVDLDVADAPVVYVVALFL